MARSAVRRERHVLGFRDHAVGTRQGGTQSFDRRGGDVGRPRLGRRAGSVCGYLGQRCDRFRPRQDRFGSLVQCFRPRLRLGRTGGTRLRSSSEALGDPRQLADRGGKTNKDEAAGQPGRAGNDQGAPEVGPIEGMPNPIAARPDPQANIPSSSNIMDIRVLAPSRSPTAATRTLWLLKNFDPLPLQSQ